MLRLNIKRSLHQQDSTGDWYIRYTPDFGHDYGDGRVTFASWDVDLHAGEKAHEAAIQSARQSALVSLRHFTETA